MTIRIIRFLDDLGSILSWSPKNMTCSCYNNDFSIHYPIVWKHCGSLDGFRRTFYRSWYMLYGSKSSFLYHFHYAQHNLASNQALTRSSHRSGWFEKLVSCRVLVNISIIYINTPEAARSWSLLPIGALWNSYRRLSTWEVIKIYLWRIDWIVMLPMLLVMSCWWPYGHLPIEKRHIKHSEQ